MTRSEILRRLGSRNLFQPATALWRVYEIEAVRDHIAFDGRILDLGCGDGSLSQVIFAGSSGERVGLEPDPADARAAAETGLYAQVHQAAGDRIPEPDRSFDVVFSNSVLEHIPQIEPVLREVSRVLRPGGRFIFTVPSERFPGCVSGVGPLGWLWRWRGESPQAAIDARLQHHRYWSPSDWQHAFDPLRLRVSETYRYFPADAVRAWERLSNLTGGIAFELMGRHTATRQAQRRLGLSTFDRLVPEWAAGAALHALLWRDLRSNSPGEEDPSGGLLLVARRDAAA